MMLTTMMKNVEKHCDDRIMLTQRDHVEWTKREEDDAEPLVTTKRAKLAVVAMSCHLSSRASDPELSRKLIVDKHYVHSTILF